METGLLIVYLLLGLGTAIDYIFYELCRHPTAQDDLRHELFSLKPRFYIDQKNLSSAALPPAEELHRLPFLNAVIKESLRLLNTPRMNPRVTPPGHQSDLGPYKNLPPGIRVGGYACLLHRSGDLYDNPYIWNPYRWLHENSDSHEGKNGAFFAFSGGSRSCVAMYLAMERKTNSFSFTINIRSS